MKDTVSDMEDVVSDTPIFMQQWKVCRHDEVGGNELTLKSPNLVTSYALASTSTRWPALG